MIDEQIYKDVILALSREPLNKKTLDKPTHESPGHNPGCGDTMHLQLQVKDDVIVDVGFQGQGCTISQAAASLLTDKLKGMTLAEVQAFSAKDMYDLIGVPISLNREKCALLALDTAKQALT